MPDYRKAYGLPERYFLSLGRMVEKKNLATLISAYARYAQGVAVAGEKLKVKGNEIGGQRPEARGQEAGDMPGGVASPPQAEASDVVTSDQLRATRDSLPALVFVGSGELENALREQARGLGLKVIDRTEWIAGQSGHSRATRDGVRRSRGQIDKDPCEDFSHGLGKMDEDGSERLAADRTEGNADGRVTPAVGGLSPETADGEDAAATTAEPRLGETGLSQNCKLQTEHSVENDRGAVFFYGFRQIEENAVFYALAEAFVLPSLYEEWGLVVNEAMACSLPVIVSRTAGCAENLVPGSEQVTSDVWRVTSGETADGGDAAATKEADARAARPYLELRSNGFVFDPRSSDALSEALRRIAGCGTADGGDAAATLKAVMGQRSREIVAKFSCGNFAQQAMRAACAARA
jgi:glycosyltransferase involved in cell wall biosynthesis